MRTLSKIPPLLVLSCVLWNFSISQVDTLGVRDSLVGVVETLVEQGTQSEDSPLLEMLFPESRVRDSWLEVRSRFQRYLQPSVGFANGSYVGSSMKSYQRIKFARGEHLSGGVLIEKDAGEVRINDFTAINLMLSDVGLVSNLILGDYVVEAGQGLAFWRTYDVSKGTNVILPAYRAASGLRPYLSSGESGFLRGAAVELQVGPLTPTLFLARTTHSATLDSSGRATSLYTSGYFRTESEQAKRDNLTERLVGARLTYTLTERTAVGVTYYRSSFSSALLLDRRRESYGDELSVLAADFRTTLRAITLFGEAARTNESIGAIGGVVLSPSDGIDLIASVRHYPGGFFSLHGLGFGEQMSNEQGMYVGIRMRPVDRVRISAYYDQFRSLEPGSHTFPANGNDLLTQIDVRLVRRVDIALRYDRKITTTGQSFVDEYGFDRRVDALQRKQNIRLNVDYRISNTVKLRGRVDHVSWSLGAFPERETGMAFYQDIVYEPQERLSFNLRLAYFKTDSYATGIYEYERDLDGVLSQPVLYGTGVRWYLLVKYDLSDALQFSAKYSDHIRDDVRRIGSGLDQLPGNHDDRIGVQIEWRME